jgi:hypothetical protein
MVLGLLTALQWKDEEMEVWTEEGGEADFEYANWEVRYERQDLLWRYLLSVQS